MADTPTGSRWFTLSNVVIASLALATLTLFSLGGAPRRASEPAAPPPTPAALAFQRAEAEAAARAEAARRQAEAAQAVTQVAEDETVLPEGHGRSETFGSCTACHSTAIIRRSRFTHAQWDELVDWMIDRHGMNPPDGDTRATIVDYLARHFGPAASPGRAANPFLN